MHFHCGKAIENKFLLRGKHMLDFWKNPARCFASILETLNLNSENFDPDRQEDFIDPQSAFPIKGKDLVTYLYLQPLSTRAQLFLSSFREQGILPYAFWYIMGILRDLAWSLGKRPIELEELQLILDKDGKRKTCAKCGKEFQPMRMTCLNLARIQGGLSENRGCRSEQFPDIGRVILADGSDAREMGNFLTLPPNEGERREWEAIAYCGGFSLKEDSDWERGEPHPRRSCLREMRFYLKERVDTRCFPEEKVRNEVARLNAARNEKVTRINLTFSQQPQFEASEKNSRTPAEMRRAKKAAKALRDQEIRNRMKGSGGGGGGRHHSKNGNKKKGR